MTGTATAPQNGHRPGAEFPHARIRRTPAPAAASRSKTPDQNPFTKTTRNPPEPLDIPLLTLVISSPNLGVFAVIAAGPGLRRGHVICSGVCRVWAAVVCRSGISSASDVPGSAAARRFRRYPGRRLCLHPRTPGHRGQADRSAGPPAARAPEAARQHCTSSQKKSLQRATTRRRGPRRPPAGKRCPCPGKSCVHCRGGDMSPPQKWPSTRHYLQTTSDNRLLCTNSSCLSGFRPGSPARFADLRAWGPVGDAISASLRHPYRLDAA